MKSCISNPNEAHKLNQKQPFSLVEIDTTQERSSQYIHSSEPANRKTTVLICFKS